MNVKNHLSICLLAAILTPLAPAAISVTRTENHDGSNAGGPVNPGTPLAVSAVDLINAGQPTLAGFTSNGFTPFDGGAGGISSPNVLNDGLDGGWNLNGGSTAVTTQSSLWTLTYSLNLSGAAKGYDITGIDVMSLWTNDFVNQRYSVEVSTVANPTFFTLTGPVTTDSSTTPGPNIGSSLMSSIREDNTGILASGVTALRFTFETEPSPSGDQHHAAYREVDVLGNVTTVPEPATCGLLLLGAGLAAIRRRR